MYYGNPTCSNQQDPTNVWDSNFVGVWHMGDAGPTYAYDSTSNNNTGTQSGGVTFGATGQIGETTSYDGSNDKVSTTLDVQPSAMPQTTWTAWIKPTTAIGHPSTGHRCVFSDDDGGYDRGVESTRSNDGYFNIFTGSGTWKPTTPDINQWQYIVVEYTPTNILFYKNGTQYSYGSAPSGQASNNKFTIGTNPGFTEYFQGLIDEIRVSNIARSASWIATEYNNQNNPESFYTIGEEEAY